MKKVFLLALLALTLFSCGYNPKDEPFALQYTHRRIIDLEINRDKGEWQYTGLKDNNYFFAKFDMPEIDSNVYNNGTVQVYREQDYTTNNPIQTPLPTVRLSEYSVEDENGNVTWYNYTETVDYEYGRGTLTIFYTVSDFDYELDETFVPETMRFRVVLLW